FHLQAVLDQVAKIVPIALKEEGCHGYPPIGGCAAGVSFQHLAPDSIVMIEQWYSIAHLEAHLQTPKLKAYSEDVK
ncbi:putative quinol monooxygenase, partial [Escherichia coli]|uniref:putative quinol monooxygenase n=1 Tax=Escherichia coli TaxID=562 RepID=UPI00193934D1